MSRTDGTVSRMLRAQPRQRAISTPVLGPVVPVRSSVPLTRDIDSRYSVHAHRKCVPERHVTRARTLLNSHMSGSLAVTASSCLVATSCLLPCEPRTSPLFRVSPLPSLYGARRASAPSKLNNPPFFCHAGVRPTEELTSYRQKRKKKDGKRRPQCASRIHPFAYALGRRATLAFAVGV
jgi:hypothetical protein